MPEKSPLTENISAATSVRIYYNDMHHPENFWFLNVVNQLFYTTRIEGGMAFLDEEECRHLVAVLRRQPGDRLELTDGQGRQYRATLVETNKRSALARIDETIEVAPRKAGLHLAIAPTKNIDRLEWMLEKAVEIGLETITPVLCKRSERSQLRLDRLEKIAVSAMKQSLRAYLPMIQPLTPIQQLLQQTNAEHRLIAWCPDDAPLPQHISTCWRPAGTHLVLIGPEGDFSPEEIELARKQQFQEVNLGQTRLRTETAGVYVTALFGAYLDSLL
jgi:16S rRNA (uracil1498-N3)-methyltransferase